MGVVHDHFSNIVYSANSNEGAWRNNHPISVSTINSRNEAIIATGFPSGRILTVSSIKQSIQNVLKYKKVRMIGSASLMLAYVACGSFDVYEEEDIYIWDVAAGLALVSEAGGHYSLKPGSSRLKFKVKASNNYLAD